MPSNYDLIRSDNIQEYGKGTRHLSYFGRMYSDRTHFIYELLQNAEDANAKHILFELFKDRLEVRHDGRLFDENDVRGISGIGEGKKAEDLTQIGNFGIGFKSVYAYTTNPEIHSGDEHFRIENYVRPYATEVKEPEKLWTTLFIFPFNHQDVPAKKAYYEIIKGLFNLNTRILLFLRNINEIKWTDEDKLEGIYKRQAKKNGTSRRVIVQGVDKEKNEKEEWLVFNRPISLSDKSLDVGVEIAFKIEKDDKTEQEGIVRIKNSPLVVYFPTEKPTNLGFYIQGPYRTTLARDNIPKEDDWNKRLIQETSILISETFEELKKIGLLTVSLLETLPINSEDFPHNSMFFPIFNEVRKVLTQRSLLPTDGKGYVSGKNAKLARGRDLINLLTLKQLQILFRTKDNLKWLPGTITQDRTPTLRSYLTSEIGIEEITPELFANRISGSYLKIQSDAWMVKFYSYLLGQEALWRKKEYAKSEGVLRQKPIIRVSNGSHTVPFQSDGSPNAYLSPQENTDFPIVKKQISSDKHALTFLKRLGLSEPDIFDEVIKKVLPKYQIKGSISISDTEHKENIIKIFKALKIDSYTKRKKLIETAKEIPFLSATNMLKNQKELKKPGEIYILSSDLTEYLLNNPDIWFLHEKGYEDIYNKEDLLELGATDIPRRIEFDGGLSREEKIGLRGGDGCTYEIKTENYQIDGLQFFLRRLKKIEKIEEKINSALALWKLLIECIESSSVYTFFSGQYRWYYYTGKKASFDAHFLQLLRDAEWLPTKDGVFKKPKEISTYQLRDDFDKKEDLIDVLEVSSIHNEEGQQRELQKSYAAALGLELDDIEFIKQYVNEFKKWKSQIKSNEKELPEFPERQTGDEKRRKEKIESEVSKAPLKTYETKERSVRVSKPELDQDVYLREKYTNYAKESAQMVCQICEGEMPFKKRDGQYYFEAVQISDDLEIENEALYLALCPVCAAKYKEYIKWNPGAIEKFINDIRNSEIPKITITLCNQESRVRFVKSHYLDTRTILNKLFNEKKSGISKSITNEVSNADKNIKAKVSKCPICDVEVSKKNLNKHMRKVHSDRKIAPKIIYKKRLKKKKGQQKDIVKAIMSTKIKPRKFQPSIGTIKPTYEDNK